MTGNCPVEPVKLVVAVLYSDPEALARSLEGLRSRRGDIDHQGAARAFNLYFEDAYAEFSDRVTPVACIPMHTPAEAIAELDHAFARLEATEKDQLVHHNRASSLLVSQFLPVLASSCQFLEFQLGPEVRHVFQRLAGGLLTGQRDTQPGIGQDPPL